jgi:hypothetical protein
MVEVCFPVANPYNSPQCCRGSAGKAYEQIDFIIVYSTLYQQSNKKAPSRDSIGIRVMKALLIWDSTRIIALVSQCICLGYYPKEWKVTKGICIPKPGKKTYEQAKSNYIILLLSCLGRLIEKVATTLITNDVKL